MALESYLNERLSVGSFYESSWAVALLTVVLRAEFRRSKMLCIMLRLHSS